MSGRTKTGWYAGLLRDGKRRALLLGPYKTKKQAGRNVARAHDAAEKIDPFCHFDAPGVFKLIAPQLPDGRLNACMALDIQS